MNSSWRPDSPIVRYGANCYGAYLCALLMAVVSGCIPAREPRESPPISWTGAARPIEEMIANYVHGRGVAEEHRPTLLDPQFYSEPTPFFLYEGNDDAVTLALSARLGTSLPPLDVYFIDLYWFKDFEPEWLTSYETLTVPIGRQRPLLRDVLAPGLREACELDGELFAVPLSIRGNCLYYRADLVPEPPRTWPELIEIAQRVLAERAENSPLRYGLTFHWEELHTDFYPILWGYGGGPPRGLTSEGELDQPLSSEANLQAIEMFYRLVHFDRLTASVEAMRDRELGSEKDLYQSFARGETLFLIDWTNRAARIARALSAPAAGGMAIDSIGIAPIPHAPDYDQSYSTIGSWGWVTAAQPRSPHSLEFVRQMATPGAQLHFFEGYAEIPIFTEQVLNELPGWQATESRLNPYHQALLRFVHGEPDRRGVILRDRPGRKDINRFVLEALHRILEMSPDHATQEFDRDRALAVLRNTDRDILRFLQRLQRLGVDTSVDEAGHQPVDVTGREAGLPVATASSPE